MASHYLVEMLDVSPLTAVSTLLVIIFAVIYFLRKDKCLPPGPTGLPLVGYWPFLQDRTVHLQLQQLAKKYGEVFSFTVAGKLFIHLGSIKAIKEAHVTKSECFSKRNDEFSPFRIIFKNGVAAVNGEEWKVLRKFFFQTFRDYGLTSVKEYAAGSVYDSVDAVVSALKETKGSPTNIIPIFIVRSSAIFRRILFNDGEMTEGELQEILEAYAKAMMLFVGKKPLLMGEFARKYLFPTDESDLESVEAHKEMERLLTKLVRRHEETFDADNIRDIIDSYIKERKDRKNKGDPTAKYFSEAGLVGSLVQLMGDGIVPVAIFIAHFLHALLEYPEEQEKIHQELLDVVGADRHVALEDKNKLPYTNAFLQEVVRTTDFFTYMPSLECTKETVLNGYKIPRGAITVTNFWSSQRDPAVFEEPDAFKPSRYLAEPGKPKTESPVIFGVGKRSCLGEAFTMMQVFLFVTAVVRNFKLFRPEGDVKKFFMDGRMDICAHPRN